jgi:hypothetical protein
MSGKWVRSKYAALTRFKLPGKYGCTSTSARLTRRIPFWSTVPMQPRTNYRSELPKCKVSGLFACWCLAPQLAGRWVEPGIPEIERVLLGRKRALEIRLSFRGQTPTVATFIERELAKYFLFFAGQIHCLRGHSGPPLKSHFLPSM